MTDHDDEPTREECLTTTQLEQLRAIAGREAATRRRLATDLFLAVATLDLPKGDDDEIEANDQRNRVR